jgi:hypothetical protein
MGKRKVQILTPYWRRLLLGEEDIAPKRRRVEEHYLREAVDKIDEIYNDVVLLLDWADEKKLKLKPEGDLFRFMVLNSRRGRKPIEWATKRYRYRYSVSLKCPFGVEYEQDFWVSQNNVEEVKGSAYFVGLPRCQKKMKD